MLGICLQVLSILGIALLVLLAFFAAVILLVLFCPFSYRICGRKDGEGLNLMVRGRWLFGLLRADCKYPEPGHIRIRILCFTLYDQAISTEESKDGKTPGQKKRGKARKGRKEKAAAHQDGRGTDGQKDNPESLPEVRQDQKAAAEPDQHPDSGKVPGLGQDAGKNAENTTGGQENPHQEEIGSFLGKLSSKTEKIKYTFRNLYDKIKKIRENISYYVGVLQKEETKQLLSDSAVSLRKIWRSIRPRHIKADIRFGTGSPDTTGYLYGIYCMLSSGRRQGLQVIPDFEETVFEGEFGLFGRITIWVLLVNGLKMYQLIRKLKAEKK